MNRELLAVVPETPVHEIRQLLRTFSISAVPVVNDERRPIGIVTGCAVLEGEGSAVDRMSRPAMCIEGGASITMAARQLAVADAHHLVVVDFAGTAVGVVSALDVLRALLGIPARHPAAFPHWDPGTQASWTDEWPLEEAHAFRAPDGAGVFVLVRGSSGETDATVWVEECSNVRDRIAALAALSSSAEPALARLLERHDLRFRAAIVHDEEERARLMSGLRSDVAHRPPPGAT